jgi:hypothetical protein
MSTPPKKHKKMFWNKTNVFDLCGTISAHAVVSINFHSNTLHKNDHKKSKKLRLDHYNKISSVWARVKSIFRFCAMSLILQTLVAIISWTKFDLLNMPKICAGKIFYLQNTVWNDLNFQSIWLVYCTHFWIFAKFNSFKIWTIRNIS